jgi:hypothetical protein
LWQKIEREKSRRAEKVTREENLVRGKRFGSSKIGYSFSICDDKKYDRAKLDKIL